MNRLHLDFSIDSTEDRTIFLNNYINNLNFQLTEDECETCANYILWGKKEDGRNLVQDGEIQIDTKYSTWAIQPEESLDALLEQPTFSENSLLPLSYPQTKTTHKKFSRSEALAQCTPDLKPIFEELFHTIDVLDLKLNYYDLLHGKRKEEPRASLLDKFTLDERLQLQTEGEALNQYTYLKLRHRLVELRREQYTLRDSFISTIQKTTPLIISLPNNLEFDSEIPVFPLGLYNNSHLANLIFKEEVCPNQYTQNEIWELNQFYWEKQTSSKVYFDFRDPSHLYALFNQYFDIQDAALTSNIESNLGALLPTLEYYKQHAILNDIQQDILECKMHKILNHDISKFINQKYNKTYSANYISTIFCQKIIPAICDAARIHSELIVNLVFPENYKRCTLCGRTLLVSDDFFVKKTRSKDGYANRCKLCDKAERNRKKNYVSKFTSDQL